MHSAKFLFCTIQLDKVFCKQGNTSEILMGSTKVYPGYSKVHLPVSRRNVTLKCVCMCYHEITHAFWELGNTLLCLCLQQTGRNYLMVISNPKCLIPATRWQGENKQLLHCYERSRSFPLTKMLVIEDALVMYLNYLYACTLHIYGSAVYYAYKYKYIVTGIIFRCV